MKSTDKIFDVKAGDFPFEGEGGGGRRGVPGRIQYKGRRQNSLAAATIFSSQLQPTFIRTAMHSC